MGGEQGVGNPELAEILNISRLQISGMKIEQLRQLKSIASQYSVEEHEKLGGILGTIEAAIKRLGSEIKTATITQK